MRILLTNDDGINSLTTKRLARFLSEQEFVEDLMVVCPDQERSGVGHAFTFFKPLTVLPIADYGCTAYSVSGMPSDCVKFAVDQLYKEFMPDLVISGPNHGLNAGIAVFYSGTLAAAREAALWGIPALALSLPYQDEGAMDILLQWLEQQIQSAKFLQIKPSTVWNVNIPPSHLVQRPLITRVCAMGESMYEDNYHLHQDSSWILQGDKPKNLFQEGTDDWHLERGEITLVPLQIAQTHSAELERLRSLW